MRHRLQLGIALAVVVAGCGSVYKKGARNAATRDYADIYSCPKGDIKTEVLNESRDGTTYEADVRATGCGKSDVMSCSFFDSSKEWACSSKAPSKPVTVTKGDPTDIPPGKGWHCYTDPNGDDGRPWVTCTRTEEGCAKDREPRKDTVSACGAHATAYCFNYGYKGTRLLYCTPEEADCKRRETLSDAVSLCKQVD